MTLTLPLDKNRTRSSSVGSEERDVEVAAPTAATGVARSQSVLETASAGVDTRPMPQRTISTIAREYGFLRDQTTVLDEQVGDGHRSARRLDLDQRTRIRAQEDVRSLLDNLSRDRGFGWSEIARLVGVSVQAIRKWRRGESPTGDNRLAVARLAAVIDLLDSVPIQDPVSWLEMRILDRYKPRHIDLYRSGHADALLDLAGMRVTPEAALDEMEGTWRETALLEHEVYEADDGQLSIRVRR
jgi:transcriptional regulator with XRE-family HTH domain